MSNEQSPIQDNLVRTDNRGLTARSRGLVRRGLNAILAEQVQRDTLWETHNNAGIEAHEQGLYTEAETLFLAAIREAERFGSQDSRFAKSLHNLANAYYKQGKYAEAEPLYERALVVLGRNNPSPYTVKGRPLYVHLNGLAIVLLKVITTQVG